MKKQDWIEYFEAINGRQPEPQELETARLAGEFIEETVNAEVPVQPESSQTINPSPVPPVQAPVQPGQAAFHQEQQNQQASGNFQEQFNQQFQNFQQNPHVAEAKKQGLNYFNWLVAALKNPVAKTEKGDFNYSMVTLVLSSLFMSGALVLLVRRILSSIANVSIGGTSFRMEEPEKYAQVTDAISSEFGIGLIVVTTLLILVIYIAAVLIPTLVERLAGRKSSVSFKDGIGKSSQFLPILMFLNFIGLLLTFTIPSSLIVSQEAMYSVSSLVGNFNAENPLSTISTYMTMVQNIPAIKSFGSVVTYLTLISFIGFVVLLVALINNIQDSIKKVNKFYVSILAVLLFVVIAFFIDKMLAEKISEAFGSFVMKIDFFKLF